MAQSAQRKSYVCLAPSYVSALPIIFHVGLSLHLGVKFILPVSGHFLSYAALSVL